METLKEEILQIINEESKGKYLGRFNVVHDVELGTYTLLLSLQNYDSPMHFSYQGDVDGFKKFIREEFRRRKLHLIRRWNGIQVYPWDVLPEDEEECDEYYEDE